MENLLDGFLKEATQELTGIKHQHPESINITIPKDHPKAAELVKLMDLLADETRLASGIVVKRSPLPGAEDEVLNALESLGIPVRRMLQEAGITKPTKDLAVGMGFRVLEMFGSIGGVKEQVKKLEGHFEGMVE